MSTAEVDRLRSQEGQASIMRSVLESIDALTEEGSPQVQAIHDVLNLKQLSILLSREMEHTVSTIRPSRYDRIASTLGAYNAICIERPTWILAYAPEEEAVLRKRYKNSFLDGAFPMTPEIRRQADMFAITKADSTRDRLKDLIVQANLGY